MNKNWQLSEEEFQDLRREMREALEKMSFEHESKRRGLGATRSGSSEVDVYNGPFEEHEQLAIDLSGDLR